jgi:hypothetical protein
LIQATFLAAVQAQLLGYSYQNNATNIEVAINLFGFVGLALDVLGAAAGLTTHISTREADYETLKGLRDLRWELEAKLREKESQFPTRCHSRLASISTIPVLSRSMSNDATVRRDSPPQGMPTELHKECQILRKRLQDTRKRLFLNMLLALKNDFHRLICMELMKFGIESFFVSLVLFVSHTQPKLVWIGVVVVIAIGTLASPLGKALGLIERAVLQRMDVQAADYDDWDDDGETTFDIAEAREREREQAEEKPKSGSDYP